MRGDILQERKCIHVKISKEVHAALRAKLFKHDLSMQEVFDEFARLLVDDNNSRATRIIQNLVDKKLARALAGLPKRIPRATFGEYDTEMLYSLINDEERTGEDDGNEEDDVVHEDPK